MSGSRKPVPPEVAAQLYETVRMVDALDEALAVHGLPPVNRADDAFVVILRTLVQILNLLPERPRVKH